MELADHDQRTDTGKHAVHHRRADRAEQPAHFQRACDKLEKACQQQDRAKGFDPVLANELEYNDGKASGGTADLKGRACEQADDDAANDACHQPLFGSHTRGDGNAHAQGHRHEEDHDRSGEVLREETERPAPFFGIDGCYTASHSAASANPDSLEMRLLAGRATGRA